MKQTWMSFVIVFGETFPQGFLGFFSKTGKKLHDMMGEFDMARALNFHGGGLIGEKLYTLTYDGILTEIHTKTGNIQLIYPQMPDGGGLEIKNGAFWFIPLKNHIYFTYDNFKMVGILDLDNWNLIFRNIEMDISLKDKMFFSLGYRDGKIYCHIVSERKLVKIDLESLQGETSDADILQDEDVIWDCGGGIPNRRQFYYERKGGVFVEYDFVEQRCFRTKIPEELPTIDCFTVKEDVAYLLARDGTLWHWNFRDGELDKMCGIEYRGNTDRISLLMTVAGPKLYIWPAFEDRIACINIQSGNEETMEFPPDFDWPELPHNLVHRYNFCMQNEDDIFVFPKTANYMPVLSKKDGSIRWIDVRVPEHDWMNYRMSVSKELFCTEDGEDSLNAYLEVLRRN